MSHADSHPEPLVQLLEEVLHGTYVERDEKGSPERKELIRVINKLWNQKQTRQPDETGDLGVSGPAAGATPELASSGLRFESIVENTPVGICITNESGIFEYVNPNYTRLYGYSEEELIGNHFTMVVPEEFRAHLSRLHDEFMGRRWELRGEWEVIRKDGTRLAILADAAYVRDLSGAPKKITFVIDITDRKDAENMLQETVERLNREVEERRRIEKMKNEVERIIQHDLRNPLSGIITSSEVLMREGLMEGQQELVVMMHDSAKKLMSMLSSSLDLIKMEEGRYEPQSEEIDLIRMLGRLKLELTPLLDAHHVTLRFLHNGAPSDLAAGEKLFGDRIYIEDMLSNLIRNAIEASAPDDAVTLDIFGDDPVGIRIHNTGVVPEQIRNHFFERYATYGKQRGNGLGTYIARLIVTVHGGEIGFTSSEAEGTTVQVFLPRVPVGLHAGEDGHALLR